MRKILIAGLLSAACLLADVSGKWTGSFVPDGESENHPVYLVFKQDGEKLTGSGGPNESEQHPMQNGKVDGDKINFEVPAGKGVFIFDLKADGAAITGNLQFKAENETRTAKVSLKKAE
jgi:hypothetical protein